MNLNIIEEKENKLLSRREIVAKITFEGMTPTRKELQTALAKQLKGDEKLTIINTIRTAFGDTSAEVIATIYSDEAVMKSLERKNLIEKHSGHEPKTEDEQ